MVTLPQGTRIDGFTIERVLGEGGFGITYLASDETLDRHVAIKEYFPQMWASREDVSVSANSASGVDYKWGLKSFLGEAKTLAKFKHPSIVQVIRIIEANGTAYMVLNYEEGDDFGKWLEKLKRPPTQKELDDITLTLLEALGAIHSNKILHRDIAPDNIKIRRDGTPVLLDFGAAREAIGQRTGTMTGIVKHGYSPVEQYSSTGKDQGPWTDIYALGATLYRAVTGKAPSEAIDRIARDDYVPARDAARANYRDGFLDAIDRALRRQHENRPQALAEWKDELFAAESIRDYKTGVSDSRLADAVRRSGSAGEEDTRPRSGIWKWAVSLVLIVVLGAGGYYLGVIRPAELERQWKAENTSKQRQQDRADAIKQDDAAWAEARRVDTIASYRAYLSAFPQGVHAARAQGRIAELESASEESVSTAPSSPSFITIGTGGVTGVYYPTGGAICRLVNASRSEHKIRCSAESTGGSIYNLNNVRAGELEFGVAQSDWQYHAYHGTSRFRAKGPFRDLRSVFSVHPEPVTILARRDASITTLTDVKGKRFNIGNPGSGTRGTWEVLEEVLGWRRSDLRLATELRSSEMTQALCDNKVDAIFWLVGHPSAFTKSTIESCNARLVGIPESVIDKLLNGRPYYRRAIIPGRVYAGNNNDIVTYGVGATIITSTKVPADVVYNVVKTVFTRLNDFRKLHPAFRNLKASEMIRDSLSAPLHRGAIKAYKELGLMQ